MSHFDPLAQKVHVRKLIEKIEFTEEDVASANLEQPKLAYAAARYRVQMMRKRMQCESHYKLVRAQWAYKYRKYTQNGKPLTNPAVEEKLDKNKFVHKEAQLVDAALIDEELAKQLFDVFKQRQVAINNVIKSRTNDVARNIWLAEKSSQNDRLKDASRLIRGKYKEKEEDEDG